MTTENVPTFSTESAANAIADLLSSSNKGSYKEQPSDADEREPSNVEDSEVEHDEGSAPNHEDTEDDSAVDDDYNDSEDDEDEDDDSSVRPSFDDEDFEVTINGEPTTVKGSELKSGYMRQSDYTRKTQELSAIRKELSEKQAAVLEQSNVVKFQAHTKLSQFEDAIQQAGGWANLRANYAPEQVEQFTNLYVTAQKEAQYADQIIADYTKQVKESNASELQAIFSNMAKTHHGFNGDTINQLDSYLAKNGFTEDMAYSMTHPQAWEMVYKAMLYDKAQERTRQDNTNSEQVKRGGKKNHSAPSTPVNIKQSSSRRVDKATNQLREANKTRDRSTQEAAGTNAIAELLKAQKRGK